MFANPTADHLFSTGLYASPGQIVTVTLPAAAVTAGLSIQIGILTDVLYADQIWARFPDVVNHFKVNGISTQVANAFGGPIYISAPSTGVSLGVIPVTVTGGFLQMPVYVLGQTTLADWAAMRASAATPWGELVSDKLIITLPMNVIQYAALDNPATIMTQWNQV